MPPVELARWNCAVRFGIPFALKVEGSVRPALRDVTT